MNTQVRFFFLSLFLLVSTFSFSQNIGLSYNNTGSGQNYTGTFAMEVGKNTFGIGLGTTVHSHELPDNQNKIFYKRQFPTENLHHLNLNLFYQRSILQNLEHMDLFLFYDFQAKHSPAVNLESSNLDRPIFHGPYYWLENSLGAGFNVNIIGDLYLTQKLGGGAFFALPSGLDADQVDTSNSIAGEFNWEFMYLINVGLTYKL